MRHGRARSKLAPRDLAEHLTSPDVGSAVVHDDSHAPATLLYTWLAGDTTVGPPLYPPYGSDIVNVRGQLEGAASSGDFSFKVLLNDQPIHDSNPVVPQGETLGPWYEPDASSWAEDDELTVQIVNVNGASGLFVLTILFVPEIE